MTQALDDAQVLPATVASRGYAVLRQAVPAEAVDGALRHLHRDVVGRGLPADVLGSWLWSSHWFPHLRWDPPVVALAWYLPEELRKGEMCDPQILLQPPDDSVDQLLEPHVDQEPPWAAGRPYRAIVGVALTAAHERNGGLVIWPYDTGEPEPLELAAGDAVVMHPRLPHSSGLNREGTIRYAVYFRFLERGEERALGN
jgi:hypothetical protein